MQLSNTFKVHCSAIGQIMTEAQTKHPLVKYNEMCAQIDKGNADLKLMEDMGKTELKSYHTLKANLIKLKAEMPELEKNKDKIHLSKTCLAHVYKWIKEQPEYYGRRKDFKSKYTDKGNFCELEAIMYASQYFGWGNVLKNEVTKENDYIIGTCDVELPNSIEDIKNSWSQDTFPLFDTEIPIDGYGWQGQGYCELWDKPQFGLVYTLMDASDFMIEKEAWSKARALGMEDLEAELFDEVKESMT